MALSGASRSPVSAPCRRDVHGEVIRPVRGLNTTPLYKGATQDEYKASVLSLRKMKNIKTKPIEHFKTMNSSQCCNNRFQFSANTFHILDCKKNTSELQKNCSLSSCKTVGAVTALKSVFDKGILLPKMIILSFSCLSHSVRSSACASTQGVVLPCIEADTEERTLLAFGG